MDRRGDWDRVIDGQVPLERDWNGVATARAEMEELSAGSR